METLYFDIKPISLNRCNRAIYRPKKGGGFIANIKSEEYRQFESKMAKELSAQASRISRIADLFVEGENFFVNKYTFLFPKDQLITRRGTINKRCSDIDNLVKPVNDQLFKAMRLYNSSIDDSAIMKMEAIKAPSDTGDYKIIVEIMLQNSLNGFNIY